MPPTRSQKVLHCLLSQQSIHVSTSDTHHQLVISHQQSYTNSHARFAGWTVFWTSWMLTTSSSHLCHHQAGVSAGMPAADTGTTWEMLDPKYSSMPADDTLLAWHQADHSAGQYTRCLRWWMRKKGWAPAAAALDKLIFEFDTSVNNGCYITVYWFYSFLQTVVFVRPCCVAETSLMKGGMTGIVSHSRVCASNVQ